MVIPLAHLVEESAEFDFFSLESTLGYKVLPVEVVGKVDGRAGGLGEVIRKDPVVRKADTKDVGHNQDSRLAVGVAGHVCIEATELGEGAVGLGGYDGTDFDAARRDHFNI